MNSYQITTANNVTYCYEASDMRMALTVHDQHFGIFDSSNDPIRCELIRTDAGHPAVTELIDRVNEAGEHERHVHIRQQQRRLDEATRIIEGDGTIFG